MFKKALLAAAAVSMSFAAAAGPNEGDWEIVFSNAGGGLLSDGDVTVLGAGIRAGYFFSSNSEFGFGADVAYVDTDAGSDEAVDLAAFYRYNWASADSSEWMYAGVELELYNVTNSDASSEMVRPHLGKKWMLSDDVAFDLNGGVNIPTESGLDESFDVRFGLSIFF